jgi:glucosamine--fructose-6-phosphate aminotransferase (isomerizing)
VIAITETDNDELDEQCEYVIRVPSTSDFLTPLLCVLPLQVRRGPRFR